MEWPGTPADLTPSEPAPPPSQWPGTPISAAASPWPGTRVGAPPAPKAAEEPSSPGIAGYATEVAKQVGLGTTGYLGTAIQALGTRSEENRRLEAAIQAIQGGSDIQEAVRAPPVPAKPLTEEPAYQVGEAFQKKAEQVLQPTGSLHPLVQDVARGFGSVGGAILSSLIPGGAISIPLAGVGEAAQTAVQKGATPEQQERAARLGTVAGITDFADLLLPSLGSTGKAIGLIKRVGLRALEGAFVEGGQEGLQQYIQNLIAQGVYKPDQDVWEDVPRSALVGALVGGGTSALIGGHGETAAPATEAQIAAAGQEITQQPPTPTTTAVQPELPLGPPTAQAELPLGGPLGPMAQLVDTEVAKLRAAGDMTPAPSDSEAIVRGRGVADLLQSDIAGRGPLETRPGVVEVDRVPAQREPSRVEKIDMPGGGPDLNVLVNPTRAMIEGFGKTVKDYRSITDGRNWYYWDASKAIHNYVTRKLGIAEEDVRSGYGGSTKDLQRQFAEPRADQAAGGIPLSREKGRLVKTGQRLEFQFPEGTERFRAVHSTTLGNLLPNVSLTHLEGKPVQQGTANALVQGLMLVNPNQRVHIATDQDMEKVSSGGGVYLYPHNDIAAPGNIVIRASELTDPARFAYVLLHEGVHSATSKIVVDRPEVAARVRLLMDAAEKHLPPEQQGLEPEQYKILAGTTDRKLYGFYNEREFLAEAFTREDFQDFLRGKQAPRETVKALGLEGKMTLWEAFKHFVRQALGLPDNRPTMSLLEAVLRVGSQIADQQAAEIAAMQAKFNKVEPQLDAVKRQPETRGVYDMISGLRDHIAPDLRDEVTRQAGYADKMNLAYKYMLHAFQLGELNPHVVDFQRYLEKMREAAVDESKINDASIRIEKDWDNLGRKQGEALIEFIDDITNMVYRSQQEVSQGVGRKPTTAEFNALAKKYKLNADALEVFRKINAMLDKFLDMSSALALQEAMKITDPVQRAKAIDVVNASVRSLKSRPYFPFMRYGRHVVMVRNTAGHVVHREHFERRGLKSAVAFQQEAMVRLRKAYPAPQYKVVPDILSESGAPMVGMPGVMLDLMAQKLRLSDQQRKDLEQLRFELAPAQSFRHRFQHKSYIKGYSKDFQRSFGQYFFHGAKWYVKTKYADAMRLDISRVEEGKDTSLTPIKRIELARFLEDHLENNFLNPKQDFVYFKAGLVFYTLAYVPVSAAVNLSQVPMVSFPYLAGKFGPVGASLRLGKAIGDWRNYYTKGKIGSMTADAMKAVNYAIQTGRLEQTLGAELAAWAQGGNLGVGYGGNTVVRGIHALVQKGMWMFSIAEKWNRRITFSATRELALAQPNSKFVKETVAKYTDELTSMMKSGFPQHEAEAILVASHVVDQTQFMASQESRPRFMRGKLGSLFLYKRYAQGLIFLTLNNKRDFTPWFIVMTLMMAGLSGLPGYDDLKEISRALAYRFFGKDFDLDREIRKLVREMTDETWAPDQVLHGLARIGFGVPWLLNLMGNAVGQSPTVNERMGYPHGPDLSRSIGLGGPILPVEVGKLFGPPISEPEKMFGEQSARAGGVMGSLALNFYRAIMSKDQPGDFKRWELMMPRAAKNLSVMYRAYSEEKARGRNDTAIIRYDTRDPEHLGEILGLGGGFQPRRLTAKWEELRDQSERAKYYETERGMLLEQWAAAVRAGNDPKEIERVRTATQEYNAGVPDWAAGMKLTPDTIRRSVEMRLRTQQMQEAGLAQQRNRIGIIRETQRLHPESVIDVRKVPQ